MKKTSILLTIMAAIFIMAAYGQAPGRPAITPEYTPVHDPVVAFCDGRYYMFSTGMGISVMSSDDMKNWSFEKQRNRYWTPSPNGQSRPYPVTTDIPGLQI